ncbi:unnamed protein product [Chrysoparadoxa australica]
MATFRIRLRAAFGQRNLNKLKKRAISDLVACKGNQDLSHTAFSALRFGVSAFSDVEFSILDEEKGSKELMSPTRASAMKMKELVKKVKPLATAAAAEAEPEIPLLQKKAARNAAGKWRQSVQFEDNIKSDGVENAAAGFSKRNLGKAQRQSQPEEEALAGQPAAEEPAHAEVPSESSATEVDIGSDSDSYTDSDIEEGAVRDEYDGFIKRQLAAFMADIGLSRCSRTARASFISPDSQNQEEEEAQAAKAEETPLPMNVPGFAPSWMPITDYDGSSYSTNTMLLMLPEPIAPESEYEKPWSEVVKLTPPRAQMALQAIAQGEILSRSSAVREMAFGEEKSGYMEQKALLNEFLGSDAASALCDFAANPSLNLTAQVLEGSFRQGTADEAAVAYSGQASAVPIPAAKADEKEHAHPLMHLLALFEEACLPTVTNASGEEGGEKEKKLLEDVELHWSRPPLPTGQQQNTQHVGKPLALPSGASQRLGVIWKELLVAPELQISFVTKYTSTPKLCASVKVVLTKMENALAQATELFEVLGQTSNELENLDIEAVGDEPNDDLLKLMNYARQLIRVNSNLRWYIMSLFKDHREHIHYGQGILLNYVAEKNLAQRDIVKMTLKRHAAALKLAL